MVRTSDRRRLPAGNDHQLPARAQAPNQAGFYVLEISLPRNLKTNYGKELPLIKTVKGTASIVTKEKKLLEKLLNLKL